MHESKLPYLTEKKEKDTPPAKEVNPIVLAKEIMDKYDFI